MEKTNLVLPKEGKEMQNSQMQQVVGGCDSAFVMAEFTRLSAAAKSNSGWTLSVDHDEVWGEIKTSIKDEKGLMFKAIANESGRILNATKYSNKKESWAYSNGKFTLQPPNFN
ncbi:MAG: hypothetical protein FWB72_00140 [Firmicutes bacterium]|nr:hypothetical protein [Bacillota bacterium]